MHIVPAPAESLMKSRVLSIPGLQGVMDKRMTAFLNQTWSGHQALSFYLMQRRIAPRVAQQPLSALEQPVEPSQRFGFHG